jgi:beta-barrel assembly-enhancing protease
MNISKYFSVFILCILCSGCIAVAPAIEVYQGYNVGKGGVQAAKAMQPIGFEEEKAIGGSLATQVFTRFGGLHPDRELQKYIATLGRALADVSDRPDIEYYFAVVNSDQPNALATPGGYIFLSVGLLRLIENEAQLAGVLGHEIAHIAKRHALHTLERSKKVAGFGSLSISLLGQDPNLFGKIVAQAGEIIFTHGLDKNLEYEADQYGLELAHRLGYQPKGLADVLKILEGDIKKENSVFFSTHPSPTDRLNHLSGALKDYPDNSDLPILAMEFQSAVKGKL